MAYQIQQARPGVRSIWTKCTQVFLNSFLCYLKPHSFITFTEHNSFTGIQVIIIISKSKGSISALC